MLLVGKTMILHQRYQSDVFNIFFIDHGSTFSVDMLH